MAVEPVEESERRVAEDRVPTPNTPSTVCAHVCDRHPRPSSRTDQSEYPDWLDRSQYPFDTAVLDLPEGRLHYVDEGEGRPVLMLHGNPTWSFLYRHLVAGLSGAYRCVVPDLLGFGLSERPTGFSSRPADHARVVERLIDALDLTDVVVVGHDWGGPIGLDYATRHPEAVTGLVMSNTWMWPRRRLRTRAISRSFDNPIGRRLVLRYNLFARTALGLPHLGGAGVDGATYRHYLAPLATRADRVGSWVFVRELVRSGDWLERLWDRRTAVAGKPALLLWGMRDPIHEPLRPRWRALFPDASEVVYDDVGHFVPEAVGPDLVAPVREFLDRL